LHRAQDRNLVVVFSLAIFLNAALLFSVQPLFTKMVLPLLGGTPAVWNTCLLFFQSVLLAGYLYAHLTSRWLSIRTQAILHLVLLGTALLVLPIAIPAAWTQPPDSALPIGWLLGLLAVSLGLPFFALSAGAPMLQRWFAGSRHPLAHNPYFLYAASNLGSFALLLAYPFVIEPRMALPQQTRTWLEFYYVLLILVALSAGLALVMRRPPADGDAIVPHTSMPRPAPDTRRRWRWILLSFTPSSLLIGVTTYLTTDIASVPFLWVLPLAIYLLTFVLVFAKRQFLSRSLVTHAQLVLGLILVVALCLPPENAVIGPAVLHLVTFFVTAMMCHGELADARPDASHLTEFYLWMSFGGVLGGVFNVIVAPLVFDTIAEYGIALAIAFALRPAQSSSKAPRDRWGDLLYPGAIALIVWLVYRSPAPPDRWFVEGPTVFILAMMFAVFFFWTRPARLALGALALYLSVTAAGSGGADLLHQERSFFGTHRVRRLDGFHVLMHGTTTHGAQHQDPARRTEPVTYYYRGGPVSDAFQLLDQDSDRRIGVVGLGSGALACYGRPNETWTFYEIDPVVARIARQADLFSYLRDCPPRVEIVIGDARLRIASAADDQFDLLVVDAFSSDAVPAHLLTREALALYMTKLRPEGIIVFHISNRFMDLAPVLSALAADARLAGAIGDRDPDGAGARRMHIGSRWVAMAREEARVASLLALKDWTALGATPPARLWTDDYTDVLSVIRWF
jgi:hypothetical protein